MGAQPGGPTSVACATSACERSRRKAAARDRPDVPVLVEVPGGRDGPADVAVEVRAAGSWRGPRGGARPRPAGQRFLHGDGRAERGVSETRGRVGLVPVHLEQQILLRGSDAATYAVHDPLELPPRHAAHLRPVEILEAPLKGQLAHVGLLGQARLHLLELRLHLRRKLLPPGQRSCGAWPMRASSRARRQLLGELQHKGPVTELPTAVVELLRDRVHFLLAELDVEYRENCPQLADRAEPAPQRVEVPEARAQRKPALRNQVPQFVHDVLRI
mmetsp:Transcript_44064/g.133473  ORF Transcript_44064/g.133473 Transcript_44064/m.133473 type:complete len:273 (-) Transcript_44064:949-1767(-)